MRNPDRNNYLGTLRLVSRGCSTMISGTKGVKNTCILGSFLDVISVCCLIMRYVKLMYLYSSSEEHTEHKPCTLVKDAQSFKKYYVDQLPDRKQTTTTPATTASPTTTTTTNGTTTTTTTTNSTNTGA